MDDSLPGACLRPFLSRQFHLASSSHHTVVTDASGHLGWAVATSDGSFSQTWSSSQLSWPIHLKELYAIYQAVLLHLDQYANSAVLVWTDNQSVIYAINKAKSHPSNYRCLLALLTLTSRANISLKAVFIPTKLNSTCDLLSRHVFSAHAADYCVTRAFFAAVGGYRCNTIAFADVRGHSARYLLAARTSSPRYCTALKSVFLSASTLAGRAIWFHPPYVLTREALDFFRHVWLSSPHHTYLLGLVPYLPSRWWWRRLIGPHLFFKVK